MVDCSGTLLEFHFNAALGGWQGLVLRDDGTFQNAACSGLVVDEVDRPGYRGSNEADPGPHSADTPSPLAALVQQLVIEFPGFEPSANESPLMSITRCMSELKKELLETAERAEGLQQSVNLLKQGQKRPPGPRGPGEEES